MEAKYTDERYCILDGTPTKINSKDGFIAEVFYYDAKKDDFINDDTLISRIANEVSEKDFISERAFINAVHEAAMSVQA